MATDELQVFLNGADARAFTREQRRMGRTVALVPTMGFLHAGHISLVDAAKAQYDVVVASIYVNPTQFSKNEDFGVYPRSQEADLAKLRAAGCTAVFLPSTLYHTSSTTPDLAAPSDGSMVVGASETYDPDAHCTWVTVDHLSQGLCARSRPHFFRGVCTVVAKLFNIVEPDAAFFGKKDYQQWRVLQRMARDLDFGVTVVGMPILREADGLAMSSRNAMLTADARARAPCIHRALTSAQNVVLAGGDTAAAALQQQITDAITGGGGLVDYVEVVDARTLQPVVEADKQPTLIAVAAVFGSVRLIDNIDFEPAN